MVDRVISGAMWALMALLAFVAASGVFVIARSAVLGHYPLIFHGLRVALLALGALVVVAALYSMRKRLTAIEARLNDR
jgi:hypothetical protein